MKQSMGDHLESQLKAKKKAQPKPKDNGKLDWISVVTQIPKDHKKKMEIISTYESKPYYKLFYEAVDQFIKTYEKENGKIKIK